MSVSFPYSTGPRLPTKWIHGAPNEPLLQCHALDSSSWVMRLSKTYGVIHKGKVGYEAAYEGCFVFLFVGDHTAALFDTGSVPESLLLTAVLELVPAHRKLDLVVAHTHSHDDHFIGDAMMQRAPFRSVKVVGLKPVDVRTFFNLTHDHTISTVPLGGRALKILWIPGHEASHIAVYDPQTHVLLTGDHLYPGRLYVDDHKEFLASSRRLLQFAESLPRPNELRVLGNHIEMSSTPGKDYPTGTLYQPDECEYVMDISHIRELAEAVAAHTTEDGKWPKGLATRDRFIVVPKWITDARRQEGQLKERLERCNESVGLVPPVRSAL